MVLFPENVCYYIPLQARRRFSLFRSFLSRKGAPLPLEPPIPHRPILPSPSSCCFRILFSPGLPPSSGSSSFSSLPRRKERHVYAASFRCLLSGRDCLPSFSCTTRSLCSSPLKNLCPAPFFLEDSSLFRLRGRISPPPVMRPSCDSCPVLFFEDEGLSFLRLLPFARNRRSFDFR